MLTQERRNQIGEFIRTSFQERETSLSIVSPQVLAAAKKEGINPEEIEEYLYAGAKRILKAIDLLDE